MNFRPRIRILAICCAATALTITGILLLNREQAAARVLRHYLETAGVHNTTFKITRWSNTQLALEQIATAGGTLKINNATAAYTLASLRNGAIDTLTLDGAAVSIHRTQNGWSLGDLDGLHAQSQTAGTPPVLPTHLPLHAFHGRDITLKISQESQPEQNLHCDRFVIEATEKPGIFRLSISGLSYTRDSSNSLPLNIEGTVTLKPDAIETSLAAADAKKIIQARILATYLPAGARATFRLSLSPVTFKPGAVQPASFWPALSPMFADASGTVTATVSGEWDGTELRPKGIIGLDRVSLRAGDTQVRNATGKIEINGKEALITVTSLDLQGVLALLVKEGLSASGSLKGSIPIRFTDQGVTLGKGVMSAAGGTIVYTPQNPESHPFAGNAQSQLVLDALKHFNYKTLSMEVVNESPAAYRVTLFLAGRNPELYGGKPIELTVQLHGDFAEIIKSSLDAYHLPESLEQRLSTPKR